MALDAAASEWPVYFDRCPKCGERALADIEMFMRATIRPLHKSDTHAALLLLELPIRDRSFVLSALAHRAIDHERTHMTLKTSAPSPTSNMADARTLDLRSGDVARDAHSTYARIRDQTPVCWNDSLRGWLITSYNEVRDALHDDRLSVEKLAPFAAMCMHVRRARCAPCANVSTH
jgi:hypothetical protein